MRAVEKFYSIGDTALLLGFCAKTVTKWMKHGDLGEVVNLGTDLRPDYRIPSDGINAYLARRRIFTEPRIAARSIGERRRKSAVAAAAVGNVTAIG